MGSTINLSIKYRPARTGLLVRAGNLDDLVVAVGINTLLAGGIYNPIIPVSEDNSLAEKLMDSYNVDVIHAVTDAPELEAFQAKYPYLVFHLYGGRIFLEDWETKKNVLIPLDVLDIIEHHWEEDFRHKPNDFKSNCVLVNWTDEDPAKYLLAVTFGLYPTTLNLRDDFAKAFIRGLCAKEVSLQPEATLDPTLIKTVAAIDATALVPRGRKGGVTSGNSSIIDGLFVGDENNFDDLVYFWNLRAAGWSVKFLPKGAISRFKDYVQAHLDLLDQEPSESPHYEVNLGAHIYISEDSEEKLGKMKERYEETAETLKSFHTRRGWATYSSGYYNLTRSGFSPATLYYDWTSTLANVDKTTNGYSVNVNIQEKPLRLRPRHFHQGQELIVTVNAIAEFAYENFTLKLPHIRAANHFFSAKVAFDPFKIRLEKDGIGVIIGSQENSFSLYPVPHATVIKAIFGYAGIQAELSQAGLVTQRVLEKLDGLDGIRVFKVRGVRQLIHELDKDDSVSRGEATKKIYANNQIKEHEDLFVEGKRVTSKGVFETLLKKDIFRAGLELTCDHCKLKSWLPLKAIDDFWICTYCGHNNQTSLHLQDRGDWRFRKNGLFTRDNKQEGAIPVILTLFQFNTKFSLAIAKTIYVPSYNLKLGRDCETDLCILQYDRMGIEVGIGECKSEGGSIDEEDIGKLMSVREKLLSKEINTYLIFSKTTDAFRPEEIERFQHLSDEGVPCILFTNRELEPYGPYERYSHEELPGIGASASTLKDMARNSAHIYLNRAETRANPSE